MEPVTLKVKRLTPTATMPTRATAGSAAFDIYYDGEENVEMRSGMTYTCHTGIAVEIP